MRCQDLDAKLADYLRDELAPAERQAVAAHLRDCERCRGEVEQAARLWQALDKPPPAPSPAMGGRFYAMLSGEVARGELRTLERGGAPAGRPPGLFGRLWPTRPAWALSYSLALLLSGVVLGEGLRPAGSLMNNEQFPALSQERLVQLCSVQGQGQG